MKMKLRLDELQVESFTVSAEVEGRGTVQGLVAEAPGASAQHTQCYTHCATACEGTCTCPSQAQTHCAGDSCDGSCEPIDTTILTIPTIANPWTE